jgi:hypothetical protein
MKNDIAIVLTATIIPNTIRTNHSDFMQRRAEYLKAIDYYHKYANIFFLENSSYDLFADKDFFKYKNVFIRKFSPSSCISKGKGYQEFEMLDNWLNNEVSAPSRWIKITGRYFVDDFDKLFTDCFNENNHSLIIEQKRPPSIVALTDIFYVTSIFYKRRFLGLYKHSDDAVNIFIEHVIRKKLLVDDDFRLFRELPLITGISGSTGETLNMTLKKKVRRRIGGLLYRFNNRYRFV